MSKIQLKNVSNMNQGIPSGPLDGKLNMREAGALDESGILDDSGIIDVSGQWDQIPEYTYVTVNVNSTIYVRYFISWDGVPGCVRMVLDNPGVNPYATGCLDDPVVNTDTEFYEYVREQVNYCHMVGQTIEGSVTIEYIKYPLGRSRMDEVGGEGETHYYHEYISYVIPDEDE